MKELSIKEKAKRYDEALKVLHKYDGANIMFSQSLKEEMFPELKESEDERIRKVLLNDFKNNCSEYYCEGVNRDMIIAWLEAQGKNNMGISEATKQKLEDSLNKALEKTTPESWNEFLDGEQKPAWSEEDKNFMYDTLSNLTELKDRYGEGYGNVGKCIDWLKSLKDRYTWKPSDEQMEALVWCKSLFTDPKLKSILESLINELKKLKG